VTVTLLTALALLVTLVGGGLVWTCALAPDRLADADRAALAPAIAFVAAALLTLTALVVPWTFAAQSTVGAVLWVAGAGVLLVARPAVRSAVHRCLTTSWYLLVPFALCFVAVGAFGVVQGDPVDTVAYPGSLVSARVTNLPPDHLFPVGAAQLFQHRVDPMVAGFFDGWDFSDRTPLAGAATASVLSSAGVTLPRDAIWRLPNRELRPRAIDDVGYWQAHLVLVLLNAFVVVAIGRLALSVWGARAALLAGLLAAVNPFVFTHVFFTWPKMLAAAFVLLHYTYVRERRAPLLIGVTAGLAYLSHPLAGIFVLPSLLVECLRGRRHALRTLGALVATVLPWQLWTALYAHTSRMLTYPLGYTMRDPSDLGGEIRTAWHQFTFGHALQVRVDDVVNTLWPFDLRRNFLSLPGRSLTGSEAWFTAHDRTLGGMALFVLLPIFVVGLVAWRRRARWEPVWMLAAPLGLAVLFWGLDAQGLGAAMLQPTGALLVVVAAGGLMTVKRSFAFVCIALAAIEAASVVWWGLFAARDGASAADIVVAAVLYALPLIGALVAVGARRADTPPTAKPPLAASRHLNA
jgi:hypothetical protein